MKRFDAYLFDFDGTLFDSRESLLPVWRYAFDKVGICGVSEEECEEFSHHTLSYAAEKTGVKDFDAFYEAIKDGLERQETIEATKMFPDTVSVIFTLFSRGLPLGIVSSNVSSHIERVLKDKNVRKYFSVLSCSDLYLAPKPNPEPCLYGLERMGLAPSKSICMVGDSLQDVECAKNAGVSGILLDRYGKYGDFNGLKIASLYELVF